MREIDKRRPNPRYCPFFLDIQGKRCVVVGGGPVASRKVMLLLDGGADVRVVSPRLCLELGRLAAARKIDAVREEYRPAGLNDAFLAIAATSRAEVNTRVAADARRRKIPVNVVDAPGLSDFIVPSHFRRGDLTVAVSTSGKSPALARKIRTAFELSLGEGYEALTGLVEEVRREIKARAICVDGDGWQQALDVDLLIELLGQGQRAKAKSVLMKNLKRIGGKAPSKGTPR